MRSGVEDVGAAALLGQGRRRAAGPLLLVVLGLIACSDKREGTKELSPPPAPAVVSGQGGTLGQGGAAMAEAGAGGNLGSAGGSLGAAGSGGRAGGQGGASGSAACKSNSDCKIAADYCTSCLCRPLGPGEEVPPCSGPGVRCFADPCLNKQAACVAGRCVAADASKPTYDPCAGKACGDMCRVCPPNEPGCAETAVVKQCDSAGKCVAGDPGCRGR
ncbi:MAG TPA: hypothetical protein VGG33_13890 [Polyangia bacterium]